MRACPIVIAAGTASVNSREIKCILERKTLKNILLIVNLQTIWKVKFYIQIRVKPKEKALSFSNAILNLVKRDSS